MTSATSTRAAEGDDSFAQAGFEILSDVLPVPQCDALAVELTALYAEHQQSSRNKIGGVRNLLRINPRVAAVASSHDIQSILQQRAGKRMFPVRALFFDKTAEANWRVPWHQDLSIAVAERIDVEGFTGWSIKDEVIHVQPPREVLEDMITVRLHLDDCAAANGALRVIPGSHRRGRLSQAEILAFAQAAQEVTCEIEKGGVLLMRPLLMHASSPATNPAHRRVLHIEYAGAALPGGLKWFEENGSTQ